jgi:hypothetical protein
MKIHLHETQFDSAQHPACGRGASAVAEAVFEAADPKDRCKHCERIWFPNGQPDWHREQAKNRLTTTEKETHHAMH